METRQSEPVARDSGERAQTAWERTPPEYRAGPSVGGDPRQEPNIADYAVLEYKKFPTYLAHNDPKSKQYVHSERDEFADQAAIGSNNYLVDRLKSDIKLQEEVYKLLENMERPYKEGIPGVHKNISAGLQNYFPGGQVGFPVVEEADNAELEKYSKNEDRFLNQTIFTPKYARMQHYDVDWPKELDARPVNKHYHPDKGYKYDVETPADQRLPHIADRLGYPEILGTTYERLMRLEGDIYHPVNLAQPFIQVPAAEPSESLNFEEGEVIYENTRIQEWAKFWTYSGFATYLFGCYFVPYSLIYKTHLSLPSSYEHLFVPTYTNTPYFFDNNGLHIPIAALTAAYTAYIGLGLGNQVFRDYVVRMQYSKDKELLFVTRLTPYGSTVEEVHEVAHLEILPPSVRSGLKDWSAQDEDGLVDVTCMNSLQVMTLYKQKDYWNQNLKSEFLGKVQNLWKPDLYKEGIMKEAQIEHETPVINIGGVSDSVKLSR